jgi:hypothetical protein
MSVVVAARMSSSIARIHENRAYMKPCMRDEEKRYMHMSFIKGVERKASKRNSCTKRIPGKLKQHTKSSFSPQFSRIFPRLCAQQLKWSYAPRMYTTKRARQNAHVQSQIHASIHAFAKSSSTHTHIYPPSRKQITTIQINAEHT